ncbi:hypothetical protein CASFOL_036544 [Castilleja foliolosa]|uniref:F-box protein At5g52880-like ARM repeats region domain-containing protein n=1 Tax=Castilleja foliolosa TaxID=1961234 RepID=A0ABD3BYC1_9LAMI
MIDPIHRYQTLKLKESLSKPSLYLFACKELSFLLKNAYSKSPKNLQSIFFQETLFAFCWEFSSIELLLGLFVTGGIDGTPISAIKDGHGADVEEDDGVAGAE